MKRKAPTSAEEILDRLGGREAVRVALAKRSGQELTPKAVEQWAKRNVIPPRWHFDLLQVASKQGASLSLQELSMTSRTGAVAA